MADASDRDLLIRFHAGGDLSLRAIFVLYDAPLVQLLVRVLRDLHHAGDALQETFVKALERLEGVDSDHLRGWLFTVAYHQAMLLKRRPKNSPVHPNARHAVSPDPTPGPLDRAEQHDDASRLRELLEQLPPGQREVIRQRVYEGKRFREIAAEQGCPLNTALARMHEGLKKLRLLWEQNHA